MHVEEAPGVGFPGAHALGRFLRVARVPRVFAELRRVVAEGVDRRRAGAARVRPLLDRRQAILAARLDADPLAELRRTLRAHADRRVAIVAEAAVGGQVRLARPRHHVEARRRVLVAFDLLDGRAVLASASCVERVREDVEGLPRQLGGGHVEGLDALGLVAGNRHHRERVRRHLELFGERLHVGGGGVGPGRRRRFDAGAHAAGGDDRREDRQGRTTQGRAGHGTSR